MDETLFTETVVRLKAVDAVIKDLDPALRPEAVSILRSYITGEAESVDESGDDDVREPEGKRDTRAKGDTPSKKQRRRTAGLDLDEIVEQHHSDKDYENARLALAIYYARSGRGPLKVNRELKAIGEEAGLILPERIDMSLKRLRHEGNVVLRKMGDGYKVTPAGERFLRGTYGVQRGRETAPEA